ETHRPISWTGGMSASVAVGPRPARTTVERSDDADRVDEAPEVEDTETTRERARSTTTARPTLASTIQAILSPAPERTAAPRASEAPARAAATPAAARPAESTPTRASTTRTAERTSERATAAPTPAEEVETPQAPSSAQTATATPVPVPTSAVTPSALATTPPPAQPERPATPPTRTPFTHRPVPAESPAQVPAPLPSRRYDRIPSAGSPATAAPRGPVLPRRAAEREWPSGLYLDSADDLTLAEERGRAADVYVVPVDGASWESITAVTTPVPLPTGPERLVLSTPLVPETGTTWAQCAMGEYETHWTQFGAKLAALPAAPIVDLGPAMNEMSAEEVSPAAYAACFAEVSRTIKKAAPEVAIQWTPVLGDQAGMSGDDVLSAWPGRAYVDVIGIDARARGLTWSQTVNGEYGLNYWASFADRQGKRIAVTRWGVHPETPTDRGVNEAYVRHVHDWIATIAAKAALAYEAYSETEDTPSDAAAAYRDLY
ncbi:MAG: hypothetical protein Q4G43_02910, partial [Mobilicoccus sp.]|nr:hypothetical protein [Mobilicoccus sp.]